MQVEVKDIQERFKAIKESMIQCLEECKFDIPKLMSILFSVCTREETKSLEENYSSLSKSENHRKLFSQLDPFWDYLSVDPLALLVKDVSLQIASFVSIEEQITAYKKDVAELKLHTKLAAFSEAVPFEGDIPPETFQTMVSGYQWPKSVALEDVEKFKKHYGLTYKLQPLAVMVNSVVSKNESVASEETYTELQVPCDTTSTTTSTGSTR